MIVSMLITIIFGALFLLIGQLPTVSDTGVFTSAITTVSTYISAIYNIFPLITGTLLLILGFDIAFEVAYMLYKVIYWVIRRFPTQA
jgi:cellobiose-specific phosphotransferase system component IIC